MTKLSLWTKFNGEAQMQQYNIHAAKTHLSALVEKAAQGEAFVIAKAGKPIVKVIPFVQQDAVQN